MFLELQIQQCSGWIGLEDARDSKFRFLCVFLEFKMLHLTICCREQYFPKSLLCDLTTNSPADPIITLQCSVLLHEYTRMSDLMGSNLVAPPPFLQCGHLFQGMVFILTCPRKILHQGRISVIQISTLQYQVLSGNWIFGLWSIQ